MTIKQMLSRFIHLIHIAKRFKTWGIRMTGHVALMKEKIYMENVNGEEEHSGMRQGKEEHDARGEVYGTSSAP
jgi:hypothetical protein